MRNYIGVNGTILYYFLICCQSDSIAIEPLMPEILNKYTNQHMIMYEINENVQQSIQNGKGNKMNEDLLKNPKLAKTIKPSKSFATDLLGNFF